MRKEKILTLGDIGFSGVQAYRNKKAFDSCVWGPYNFALWPFYAHARYSYDRNKDAQQKIIAKNPHYK